MRRMRRQNSVTPTGPRRTKRRSLMSLFGRVEQVLNVSLARRIIPGAQEAADRVNLQHVLKWQRNFGPQDIRERQIENWVIGVVSQRHSVTPFRPSWTFCRGKNLHVRR